MEEPGRLQSTERLQFLSLSIRHPEDTDKEASL